MNLAPSRCYAAVPGSFHFLILLMALCIPAAGLKAQTPGALDPSFDAGSGYINGTVQAIVPLPDGKVLVAGNFTSVRGGVSNRIARLNGDGSLDTTFNPGLGTDRAIYSIAVQSDGKVLIAGWFTSFNGTARNSVARLNTDGSLDSSFNPGVEADSSITHLAVQSDGKVILAGYFTSFNGIGRNSVARLNANGSLDTTFNPGAGASSTIDSIALQSDGKVLIAGSFTLFNNRARNRIARLNADGSLDASFDPSSGPNNAIFSAVLQSDGKVLIAGAFTSFSGTGRNRIARLNADGSLDTDFNPGSGADKFIDSLVLQGNGKVLIAGDFTSFNATSRNRIARLNADGSLDTSFDPGSGPNIAIDSITLQSDAKVFIAGDFTSFNDTLRDRIARLNTDGSLDTSFDPSSGVNSLIYSVAVQSDRKVLIAGDFASFNGTARSRIARLNADGSLDTSFNPGLGADNAITSLAVQSDGKVLIAGQFTSFNGTARSRIARLNANGSLDTSFNPGSGANNFITAIAVQSDGKVLVAGQFTSFNGTVRNRITRLNVNGSLDTSFYPGSGPNNFITSLAVQSDGKVLVAGQFTSFSGTARNRVTRLNPDGSLDASFNPGSGADYDIYSLALQSDGKALIAGDFASFNGMSRIGIARLNADGTLDAGFDPDWGANDIITSIAVQSDGKALIAGQFTGYNTTARNRIARLNADGSLDSSFNPGTGASNHIYSLALQSDGKVLIAGQFTSYNGTACSSLARLGNDPPTQSLTAPSATRVQWLRGGATPEAQEVRFELSTDDGSTWTGLGMGTRITDGWELTGLNLPPMGQIRARARTTGGWYNGSSGFVETVRAYPTPAAPAGTATNITRTSADLNGTLHPNGAETTVVFQTRKPSEAYTAAGRVVAAQSPVPASTEPVVVSATKTGLKPGTTYEFNIATENSAGTRTSSESVSFTTQPNAAPVAAKRQIHAPPAGIPTTIFDVAQHASDADGDPLTVSIVDGASAYGNASTDGKAVTFASSGWVGSVTVQLQVSDGFTTTPVQVVMNNVAPTALADGATAITRTSADLNGTVNPNGAETTVIFQTRKPGELYTSAGSVVAVQSPVPAGTDSVPVNVTKTGLQPGTTYEFNIAVQNSAGGMSWSESVSFTTLPNAAPVAAERQIHAPLVGIPTTIFDVAQHASDADGDSLTVSIVDGASTYGSASTDGQTVSFTSSSVWVGSVTVQLQVSDGFTTTPVQVVMNNAAPAALADTAKVRAGQSVTVPVLANDSDADGDTLAISSFTQGANGGSISSFFGSLSYTAPEGFTGTDTFSYTLSDGRGGSASASVTVKVTPTTPLTSKLTGKGDAVPGAGEDPRIPEGSVWSSFGVPSINDSETVAFLGNVAAGSSRFSGIFAGEAAAPVLISRKGDTAPGAGEAQFASFRDPLLSNAGELAFLATLSGPGVRASNRQGLWKATPDGSGSFTLELLARAGDEPAGVAGARWKSFLSVLLHGEAADPSTRSVVLLATMATGPGKVTSGNDLGLWRFDQNGAQLLLREGQPLEVRGVTSNVRSFLALSSVSGSPGHDRVSAAQGALIQAKLADGRSALLQADGQSLSVLAATGDEIESGVFLTSLGIPGGDLAGASLAKVTLKGTGVTSATNTAIALLSKDGPQSLLYRTGTDTLPAEFPQMKPLRDPVANARGQAFLATLAGKGITSTTNTAIVWQDGDQFTIVARAGEEPAGVAGARWKSFTSMALPEDRGPLFTATLRVGPGKVKSTNDAGLWSVDNLGALHLVAREGAPLEGKTLRNFTVLSAVSGSPAQRRSYNTQGALIYRAYFNDGSQALIKVQLP